MQLIGAAAMTLVAINATAADTAKQSRAERQESRETRADINDRIRDLNQLDNKPAARLAGLRAVSKETGVPVPTLEAQHKQHPKIGIAGLLVANDIAVRGKADVSQLIRQRNSGKTWNELAQANHVPFDTVEAKLGQVETAMREAK